MKKIFLLTLIAILISCSSDDNDIAVTAACGVSNPILELSWLREEIENRTANQTEFSQYDYITQGQFDGQTIFLYKNCNPLTNSVVPVIDCEGTMLGLLGNDFPQNEILDESLIWKNEESACDFTFFGD